MTIALALIRTLIGLAFVAASISSLAAYSAFVEAYARWGIPAPGFAVFLLAAIEAVCGVFLMIGWLVRPAALVLATIVVEVWLTAGRADGGIYLVVSPVLFATLVFYAWRSGRYSTAPTHRPGTQG
jgi:uncharacterized membrane protein YphA (DoxX/SURF4 family)